MKTSVNQDGRCVGFRIGYCFSEKKIRKFNLAEFLEICRNSGLVPVPIDLNRPLEEQGPFTLILHKLTDVIAKANWGDSASKTIIQSFKRYLRSHPEVIVIDPLENILALLDRTRTYNLISCSQLSKEHVLCTPAFVELNSTDLEENVSKLRSAGVHFPIICKPTVAHGSSLAHQMAVIFHEEGLRDIIPPCVAQMFVNHNAILYKLYVIGNRWYQVDRPSLKNFYPGNKPTIFFDSHQVSKADSACVLNKLDEEDQGRAIVRPVDDKLQEIVSTVRETLQMGLFGIDVVIDNETGCYAIVDINAFPGYDGVPDFPRLLIDYMLEQIHNSKHKTLSNVTLMRKEATLSSPSTSLYHQCACTAARENEDHIEKVCDAKMTSSTSVDETLASVSIDDPNTEDSGIDTGYSSDEKKNKKQIVAARFMRRQHSRGASVTTTSTNQ